ncbi:MAG: hypothetical protein FWD68_00360 [Alphaproteobacteria bacterium]|nr:hypothetical protein [Alphaproteobacteria bacterium]
MAKRKYLLAVALVLAVGMAAAPGEAREPQSSPRLFVSTWSNNTPLSFGMDVEAASQALGQRLELVSSRRDSDIFMVVRDIGGSELLTSHHRLFLQFRHGRLTGWKEDYGDRWMWGGR